MPSGIGITVGGDAIAIAPVGSIGRPPDIADGFTAPNPSWDSRLVYVSFDTGNDSNPGTFARPRKTIAAGKALLRSGMPDWLLLKRGETWDEAFGSWVDAVGNPLSGRSDVERMVITTYGSGARPILRHGVNHCFVHSDSQQLNNLYILGIDMYSHTNAGITAPCQSVRIAGAFNNLHIEDCKLRNANSGVWMSADASGANLTVRRCVIMDTFEDLGTFTQESFGVSLHNTTGVLIEESYLDSIAYPAAPPGSIDPVDPIYPIYCRWTCPDPVIRNNIISKPGSGHGIVSEAGGVIHGNIFIECSCAMELGYYPTIGGSPIDVYRNLIIEGVNHPGSVPFGGIGIIAENVSTGQIKENIIAHSTSTRTTVTGIYLKGANQQSNGRSAGLYNLTITGNKIYKWALDSGAESIEFEVQQSTVSDPDITNCTLVQNDVQEPDATLGYLVSSNGNWYDELTAGANRYNRGGVAEWFRDGLDALDFADWQTATGQEQATEDHPASTDDAVVYVDPEKKIGDYWGSKGHTATTAAFRTACRAQARGAFDEDLLTTTVFAYFMANFLDA